MTKTHTDNSPVKMKANEARAGRRVKGMTTVLGVSLAAAVIIGIGFMIAYT